MCGIVAGVSYRNIVPILTEGLRRMEYRGYDSCGVAVVDDGQLKRSRTVKRVQDLIRQTEEDEVKGSTGIAHTRWATHGAPEIRNTHPLFSNNQIAVVHNGIIENYGILKERLIAKGYTFESETDTEVLVKLIDSCYTGDPLRALQEALAKVRGSYALAVLFRDRPDTIFAVKRESPLIVGWGEGENFVASDIPALLKYTRTVYYIDNLEIARLTPDSIEFFNIDKEPITRESTTIEWDAEAAEKGGYEHFMMKEIYEQPAAVRDTISPRLKDGQIDLSELDLDEEAIRNVHRLYIRLPCRHGRALCV